MDRDIVRERLQGLCRQVFGIVDLVIDDRTTAADVPGWDSLSHARLIVAVEEHFGIRTTMREVIRLENVGQMISLVASKLGPRLG